MRFLLRVAQVGLLAAAFAFWRAEHWIWRRLGRVPMDNCATWAADHFDYAAGDGVLLHQSLSGWFPHVVVVRGARDAQRPMLYLHEYVPLRRVAQGWMPPRKFAGRVRVTRFVQI